MTATDRLRGDVRWTDLDPTRGAENNEARPIGIITTDSINRVRRSAPPAIRFRAVDRSRLLRAVEDGVRAYRRL